MELWTATTTHPIADTIMCQQTPGMEMMGPRTVFARAYHERWTRVVFVVTKLETDAVLITYRVKDLMDEEISAMFYAEELQLIDYDPGQI